MLFGVSIGIDVVLLLLSLWVLVLMLLLLLVLVLVLGVIEEESLVGRVQFASFVFELRQFAFELRGCSVAKLNRKTDDL